MLDDLLAARLQMALSLGFHIVFAAIGMAMPFLMAAAHGRWLRRGDDASRVLTRAWSKGVAIFFAIGAVSGTALSFELGLLWPEFMRHAGPVIGMPFSWEGAAFFLEAVALGLFLYGWDRMPRWAHWTAGFVVGIAGVLSAWFVVCANAWMNSPAGFVVRDGRFEDVDPFAAMFNPRSFDMGLHMVLAALVATGFAVAGVHAYRLLRHPAHPVHTRALRIALAFGGAAAMLQPISGDLTAKRTAATQPLKLAALEARFETRTHAPLIIGGLPDTDARRVDYGLEIPSLLSFLAYGDPAAKVDGLEDFPRDEWPPVVIVHLAFQVMVGIGSLLAAVGAAYFLIMWKRPALLADRRVLRLLAALTPFGFLALEAGWVVTEVGRQPWIVYGVLRTRDAVTPMPGLVYTLVLYAGLYTVLASLAVWLLARHVRALETGAEPGGSHA
jgi:cytochrome d ubiquinol oxidase subunit I